MTRHDLRLVFAIVSAAVCAAAAVAVLRWHEPSLATAASSSPVPHREVTQVETKLAQLETRVAALEAAKSVDTCDEVHCVLDNYAPPCCAQFDRQLPVRLDRLMLAQAMAEANGPIYACGARVGDVKGQVVCHFRVEPDGSVSTVKVLVTPNVELSDCVTAQLEAMSFPRTQEGGTFRYPFEF